MTKYPQRQQSREGIPLILVRQLGLAETLYHLLVSIRCNRTGRGLALPGPGLLLPPLRLIVEEKINVEGPAGSPTATRPVLPAKDSCHC